jgi:hypothetical protein
MNYKSIALQELVNYANSYPEYTLSEILYSFLREKVSGIKETKDIHKLTDEDIYSIIEQVRDQETAELT